MIMSQEKALKNCEKSHVDKNYNYSRFIYKGCTEDIEVECPLHGWFWQRYQNHARGQGCPLCHVPTKVSNTAEFIRKAILVHGNRYIYDKVIYVNNYTKVIITCRIHGDFLQSPNKHLDSKRGCPKCHRSNGESLIEKILKENNIKFETQKIFKNCRYKNRLEFDFYIPLKNVIIEYDGIQHFIIIDYFGGENNFKRTEIVDNIKNKYCEDNNIAMIRLPYWLSDKDLKEILLNDIFQEQDSPQHL